MDMIPPPLSHVMNHMQEHDFPSNLHPPANKIAAQGVAVVGHDGNIPDTAGTNMSGRSRKRNRSVSGGSDTKKEKKNNREKQRRSELNSQFETLLALCGLDSKNKPEKYTILSESSALIRNLLTENHQLKSEKMELEAELSRMGAFVQKSYLDHPPRQVAPQYSTPVSKLTKKSISTSSMQNAGNVNEELDIFQ